MVDKFVAIVSKGEDGTRSKDYEDFSKLYPNSNKSEFYKMLNDYINRKDTEIPKIIITKHFNKNMNKYQYIGKYNMEVMLQEVIDNVK